MRSSFTPERGLQRGLSRRRPRLALALFVLGLAGCAGAPPETYDLTAPPVGLPVLRPHGQLVVSEPVASAALDSERIVVRPHADQVAYLTGAQWSDRLPALIQTRLIQTFENAKMIRSVGRPGDRLAANVTLESEIRSFEIDVEPHEASVEISAKLVAGLSGKVVAAEVFTARVPVSSASAATAAPALDAALGDVLKQIVAWASGHV